MKVPSTHHSTESVTSVIKAGRSRYKANYGTHYPPMICAVTIRHRMLDSLSSLVMSRGCHSVSSVLPENTSRNNSMEGASVLEAAPCVATDIRNAGLCTEEPLHAKVSDTLDSKDIVDQIYAISRNKVCFVCKTGFVFTSRYKSYSSLCFSVSVSLGINF